MKDIFCPSCNSIQDMEIIIKDDSLNVRGEIISFRASIAKCKKCGEEVFNEELDSNNLENAYIEYRSNHNLLTPAQIRNIRNKYGLSQRSLGALLEWGEITVHRYESGGIQDQAHNDALLFIDETQNMKDKFEKNGHLLSKHAQVALKDRLEKMIAEEIDPKFESALELKVMPKERIDEYTGFKRFDLDKIKSAILYIACFQGGTFRTMINKIMWYADFLHYKKYSVSITGSLYLHMSYGPTFKGFDLIIGSMYEDNLLESEEVIREGGYVSELLKSRVECDDKNFQNTELEVLDFVLKNFKDYTCKQISEQSHEEEAYKQTSENEQISYKFADKLSLVI